MAQLLDPVGNTSINHNFFRPLEFNGQIDYSTHERLVDSVKDLFQTHLLPIPLKNKAIHVVIECLENMYKHSENIENQIINDSFSVSLKPDTIFLSFSNPVTKKRMLFLKEKFENIENLSVPEIKAKYNEQLRSQINFSKNGAGLGILRIGLLSNNKIKYNFEPISENSYYFRLFITIDAV